MMVAVRVQLVLLLLGCTLITGADPPKRKPDGRSGARGSDGGDDDDDRPQGGRPGDRSGPDSREDGDDDRRGGGERRPGGAPACDLENLPDVVPMDVQDAIAAVVNGSAGPGTLAAHLGDIPTSCIKPLADLIKDKSCSVENVITAICEADGQTEKMRVFFLCLDEDEREEKHCDILKAVVQNEECEESGRALLTRFATDCDASDLDFEQLILLPPEKLVDMFEDMSAAEQMTFLNNAVDFLRDNADIVQHIPCPAMKVIIKTFLAVRLNTEGVFESPMFWSNSFLLPYLPKEACESIPASTLVAKLGIISQVTFPCDREEDEDNGQGQGRGRSKRTPMHAKERRTLREDLSNREDRSDRHDCSFGCGRILIKKILAEVNITDPTIKAQLTTLLPCQSLRGALEQVEPGQCGHLPPDMFSSRSRAVREVAEKCMPEKPPANWTVDDVEGISCAVMALPARVFRQLSKEVICNEALLCEKLSTCLDGGSQQPDNMERLARLCADEPSVICLRQARVRLPPGQLRQIPPADLKNNPEAMAQLEDGLREMRANKDKRKRAVAFLLADKVDLPDVVESEEVAQMLPMKKVRAAFEGKKVKDVLKLGGGKALRGLSLRQKGAALRQHLKDEGIDSPDMLDREKLREMGPLALGMTPEEVKGMDPTSRRENIQALCENPGWTGRQSEALGEELVKGMEDSDYDNPGSALGEDEVFNMEADCLSALRAEHLAGMERRPRRAVCFRLGSHRGLRCLLNSDRRMKLAEKCANKTDVDDDDDMSDPMNEAGQLLGDVDEDVVEKMEPEEVLERARHFKPIACLRQVIREKVIRKLDLAVTAEQLKDPEVLKKLGRFALRLNRDKLKEAAEEVANQLEPEDEDERTRFCCRREHSDDERRAADMDAKAAAEALKDVIDNTEQVDDDDDQQTRRRRKRTATRVARATDGLTCQDLEDLDLSVVTVTQIENMAKGDIVDCISVLGRFENWDDDVRDAILSKFIGDIDTKPCQLSTEQLTSLGSVAYSLTTTDIACLENFAGEIGLGGYSEWSSEQLPEFAKQYIKSANKNGAATLDKYDVNYMGHFVCGLTAEDIGKIPNAVYGDTSSVIGQLDRCPTVQLKAWARHAIKQFGPIKDWDASHFMEAGILIGGMSSAELNLADKGDVMGWRRNGIQHIPAGEFKGVDIELLEQMNREQALAVSDEQLGEMSIDRMNAVYYSQDGFDGSTATVIRETDVDPNDKGDACLMRASLLLLFSVLLLLNV